MLGAIVLWLFAAHAAIALPATAQASGGQQSASQTGPEKPWPPAGVFVTKPGSGVTAPRLIRDVKPNYTADAMRAKIEGIVVMQAIIERTGRVGEVRVKQSLDRQFGLDEQALRAVRQWRFEPGQKDGVAVRVLVDIEMTFALRK